jgi:hypothetical protein
LGRKSQKPLKEELINLQNPFVEHLKIKVAKKPIRNAFDKEGNPISIEIEQRNAINLYKSLDNKNLILSLTKVNSHKLLFFIIYNIQDKDDTIRLNKKLLAKRMNLSINPIADAIKELITKEIIKQSPVKDYYWVNPKILFFGSRKNKYPNNINSI